MSKSNKTSLADLHAETEAQLFRQIWLLSKKRSFLSDLFLRDFVNTPQFPSIFAHILPKGRYPHFRLYAANIRLLHPDEHHILDQGTEEDRIAYSKKVKTADWSKLDQLQEQLEEKYKQVFPFMKHGIIGYKYTDEEVFLRLRNLNSDFFYGE